MNTFHRNILSSLPPQWVRLNYTHNIQVLSDFKDDDLEDDKKMNNNERLIHC